MGSGLSMTSRAEITTRYARAYVKAWQEGQGPDAGRGGLGDRLVAGQCPAPADRGRQAARRAADGRSRDGRGSRGHKVFLRRAEGAAEGVGRLGRAVRQVPGRVDAHPAGRAGAARRARARPGPVLGRVRAELLAMSAATIDRYLAPARAKDAIRGVTTTKPSPLLRSAITIRKAGDEVEAEPGFFEGDTVAHCGPTLKGEFARTLNLTDVHTGWVFTRTMRNNAHTHILTALQAAVRGDPLRDNRIWTSTTAPSSSTRPSSTGPASEDIYFTRSRPYKKNDQATIESKNNHLVRKYGFYYRYDTDEERRVLNRLWKLVNDRLNYLTPTKKPVGYGLRPATAGAAASTTSPDPAGPAPGRRRPLPGPGSRADRLPRRPQPGRDRPADRRPADPPAHPVQGQDRAALPGQLPHRPTRRPQGHPRSRPADPEFRGHSYVRHGSEFRGHLDVRHHGRHQT